MTQDVRYNVIVGLGATGLSCARFLRARGAPVALLDTREHPPQLEQVRAELPDVPLLLGPLRESALDRADTVFISPGVDPRQPFFQAAAARGIPVLSEIELFARHVRGDVAGITGSNGKSTCTQLLGLMAAASGRKTAIGGNFGRPALDLLSDDAQLYVLELSSFQMEATHSLAPAVGVILNISEDHMDRYDSMAAYAAAKYRLADLSQRLVVNLDDALTRSFAARPGAITFSTQQAADFCVRREEDAEWIMARGVALMRVSDIKIPGRHNLANVLAVLALAEALGLDLPPAVDVIRRFAGLPHRMQWVSEQDGITYINDSKATNVGATVAALSGAGAPVVLIAGGEGKGQDFTPLIDAVSARGRAVVLMGKDAALVEAAIGGRVPTTVVPTMAAAVKAARGYAHAGDLVLLSPACASLDMFRNFEERGDAFVQAVLRGES